MVRKLRGTAKMQTAMWLKGKLMLREQAGQLGKLGQRLGWCLNLIFAPPWQAGEIRKCLPAPALSQTVVAAQDAFSAP